MIAALSAAFERKPLDNRDSSDEKSSAVLEVPVEPELRRPAAIRIAGRHLGVAGDDLFEGDTIGFVYEWNMGPLLTGLWISLFAVFTCCGAAIYPAVVAARTSSAESLNYE